MPILILMALPLVEVYLLYLAAISFGFVNLIFFLLVKGMIGKMIMRKASLNAGEAKNLLSTASLGLAGLLISLPALITSSVGVLILLPPTRWLLSKLFKNLFKNLSTQANFKVFNFGGMSGQNPFAQQSDFSSRQPHERDVTPLVIDVTPINKSDDKTNK